MLLKVGNLLSQNPKFIDSRSQKNSILVNYFKTRTLLLTRRMHFRQPYWNKFARSSNIHRWNAENVQFDVQKNEKFFWLQALSWTSRMYIKQTRLKDLTAQSPIIFCAFSKKFSFFPKICSGIFAPDNWNEVLGTLQEVYLSKFDLFGGGGGLTSFGLFVFERNLKTGKSSFFSK